MTASVKIRQVIERAIRERIVDDLLTAGFALNVDNGGDDEELPRATTDRETILGAMYQTDEERLYVYACGDVPTQTPFAWVYFAYGNNGWDVISDYTTNLEPYLKGADAISDAVQAGTFRLAL